MDSDRSCMAVPVARAGEARPLEVAPVGPEHPDREEEIAVRPALAPLHDGEGSLGSLVKLLAQNLS